VDDGALDLAKQTLAVWDRCGVAFADLGSSATGAWELLLILYAQEAAGAGPTRANVAARCRMSPPIVDRWLALLACHGLLAPDPGIDGPLRLTEDARETLETALNAVPKDER
jgi:DNA-binding IscR family transcriptional regulator